MSQDLLETERAREYQARIEGDEARESEEASPAPQMPSKGLQVLHLPAMTAINGEPVPAGVYYLMRVDLERDAYQIEDFAGVRKFRVDRREVLPHR